MSSMSMRRLNSTLSAKSGGSQTKSSARAAGASVKQGRPYRSSVNNSESTKALSSSASSAGMYDVGNDSGRDSVLTDSTGSSSDRLAGPAVAALTHMISRRMVTDSIEKIAEEDFLEDVKDGEDSNKNSIMPFATDSLEAMDQPPVNNKAINANFSKSFVCALPAKNMIEMLHQDSSSDKSAVVTLRVAAQGIQVPEETSTAEVSADSVLDRHPVLNQRSEALKSTIKPSHKNVLIGSSSRIGIEATSREVAVVDSNENFTETLNDSPSSPAPLTAFEKFKRSTSRSTSRSQSGRWVGKSISIRESFNAVVEFSGKINLSQKIAMMSPLQMEGDNDFEKYKARMMITRLSSVDNGTTDLESNLPQTESKGKRKMSMMDHLRMVQQQFEAEKGAIEQHENDIMNLYDSIDADAQEREVADSAIPYQSNAMRENVYKTRRKSWGKGQLRSSFASVDEETELV